ncbi:hypothetical protein D3C71_1670120 [compost metagenome]
MILDVHRFDAGPGREYGGMRYGECCWGGGRITLGFGGFPGGFAAFLCLGFFPQVEVLLNLLDVLANAPQG